MNRRRRPLLAFGLAAVLGVIALVARFVVFPGSAEAAATYLSVMSGSVSVQEGSGAVPRPARDGEKLRTGDRVVTSADGRAILTFFDGSTLEVEPNTDITVEALDRRSDGSFGTGIRQAVGTTWNNVFKSSSSDNRYQISTPAAVAAVRDTQFQVRVETDGITTVTSREGSVVMTAAGASVVATAGTEVRVIPGQAPQPPTRSSLTGNELNFGLASAACLLVVAPGGLSVGSLPPDLPVNQIPLTLVSECSQEPQRISLVTLQSGVYKVLLNDKHSGEFHFSLDGTGGPNYVGSASETGSIKDGERLAADLTVNVQAGVLVSFTLSKFGPGQGAGPYKVLAKNTTNAGFAQGRQASLIGGPHIIAAPASVEDLSPPGAGALYQQAFEERLMVTLAGPLAVDGDSIPAGRVVNSHMVFLNRPDNLNTAIGDYGRVWTFDGRILGVMSDQDAALENASSAILGNPSTIYPSCSAAPQRCLSRGLENPISNTGACPAAPCADGYHVGTGAAGDLSVNQIRVGMAASQPGDWIRVVTRYARPVEIDIKPDSFSNAIDLKGQMVPVAILSSAAFDSRLVDPSTVCFGDAEHTVERDCTSSHDKGSVADVNKDGLPDLVFQFKTAESGIGPGDTSACLTGLTLDRNYGVRGCDSINVKR